MSQPEQSHDALTDLLLKLALIGGVILLVAVTPAGQLARPAADAPAVAQEPSVTPLPPPTVTPLPPTVTPPPEPTAIPSPTSLSTATATALPPTEAVAEAGAQPIAGSHDPAQVAEGEALYMQCAACHGPDARGLPNLGKDLVDSEFMAGLSDEELLQFIIVGRPIWDPENTTGVDLPGQGGNPALTSDDIRAIIAYLRTLGGDQVPAASDGAGVEAATAYDPALVVEGEVLYMQCAACHGPDARGLPNLGKDLVDSEFMAGLSDEELQQFIIAGRPIWDPENTTGVDMPGKGGNPALTGDDIMAIIAYLRTLGG